MEQTCEFCAELILKKYTSGKIYMACGRGWNDYVACQIAGTDNYFEPRGSSVLKGEFNANK